MHLITIVQLILVFVQINGHLHLDWEVRNPALNQSLYEDVLDSVECQKQIGLLQNNTFLLSLCECNSFHLHPLNMRLVSA